MLAGPIFNREALTAPRQLKHFLLRAGYVAAWFVLLYTLGQVTFGWQQERRLGDLARFGALVFQSFALIQLALLPFFALVFAAGNVAQEKDRKTLILLLMTDLRNREMVLGKLGASLLIVGVLLAASWPVFALVTLLGGVSAGQVGWAVALTGAAVAAAGSWGTLIAFWREKTFQTLAWCVLGMVLFLAALEAGIAFLPADSPAAGVLGLFNPFRGMRRIIEPFAADAGSAWWLHPGSSVLALGLLAAAINAVTILRLRVWNPSDARWFVPPSAETEKVRAATRTVWENPILWREIQTAAYGARVIVIKLAYLVLFAAALYGVAQFPAGSGARVLGMISPAGFAFVSLGILALMLVNTQAVTAFTTERDAATLELLLVTDITAQEFIYGKLGGILFNTKEVVLLPALLAGFLAWQGQLSAENLVYVLLGYVALVLFSAMLGLHSGISFDNSRTAIANSLGTMFFLFLGIFVCMMLIIEARASFWLQLPSFVVFILGGSLGLASSLTHKNPSKALHLAAFLLPFLTFYAITGFQIGDTLSVCLAIVATYGYTTIAMLVPAVSEFDVALGRTTLEN